MRTNGFCGNLLITDELSVVSFFQTLTKCTLLTCDELHLLIFENV